MSNAATAETPRFLQSFTVGADRMDKLRLAIAREEAATTALDAHLATPGNISSPTFEAKVEGDRLGSELRKSRHEVVLCARDLSRYAVEVG